MTGYRPYNDHNDVIFACRPWRNLPPEATRPPPPKPRLSKIQTDRRRSGGVSSSLDSHHAKRCPYCQRIMLRRGEAPIAQGLYPTRDHVVPRSEGGTAILIVCARCNNEKSNMMPDAYLERLTGCRRTLARLAMIGALQHELAYGAAADVKPFKSTAMADAFRNAIRERE